MTRKLPWASWAHNSPLSPKTAILAWSPEHWAWNLPCRVFRSHKRPKAILKVLMKTPGDPVDMPWQYEVMNTCSILNFSTRPCCTSKEARRLSIPSSVRSYWDPHPHEGLFLKDREHRESRTWKHADLRPVRLISLFQRQITGRNTNKFLPSFLLSQSICSSTDKNGPDPLFIIRLSKSLQNSRIAKIPPY